MAMVNRRNNYLRFVSTCLVWSFSGALMIGFSGWLPAFIYLFLFRSSSSYAYSLSFSMMIIIRQIASIVDREPASN